MDTLKRRRFYSSIRLDELHEIMHKKQTQLTLGFNLKDEFTFDNFYPGKHPEILVELQKMARGERGEGEHTIFLCAMRGQGLSHLLQASCRAAHQHQKRSVYLPLNDLISLSPALLQGLENLSLICIDDVHLAAGIIHWEEAIFHLYNRVQEQGGRLLFAAHDLPKALHFKLPDLVSRFTWGILYQLHALSDDEKIHVLIKRAIHRGIVLSEEAAKYLLHHRSRHMGALFDVLDILDKASLAAKRRLTIPFIKEILQT